MKNFLTISLFLLLFAQTAAFADVRTPVELVRISDGDTVVARIDKNEFKIRLIGIDCYETAKINRAYKQAYQNNLSIEEVVTKGLDSKRYLEELYAQNKNSKTAIEFKGLDIYNRVLGVLDFDKLNVNKNLKLHGGCMMY